jgi:predicted HTH transcriptional regulator
MTKEELLDKLSRGENDQLEFKRHIQDPKTLAHLIAGFANNKGGQLIVGVKEYPVEIVGAEKDEFVKVLERAKKVLNPVPNISLNQLIDKEKRVIILDIEKSKEIIFSDGSVYQRVGELIKPMNHEEIHLKLKVFPKEDDAIDNLAIAIAQQSKIIEELRTEISNSNSWKTKIKDHLVSGIIGAVIGFLFSLAFS